MATKEEGMLCHLVPARIKGPRQSGPSWANGWVLRANAKQSSSRGKRYGCDQRRSALLEGMHVSGFIVGDARLPAAMDDANPFVGQSS